MKKKVNLLEKKKRLIELNERGNFLIILGIALLLVILAPTIAMAFFWPADLLIRLILAFLIFSTVRAYLGNGVLSIVVSGILIYFLAIKWANVAFTVYMLLFVLLGLQFFSVLMWGLATTIAKKH